MQIRLKKTKAGVAISIRAKKGVEGVHLKNAVLSSVGHGRVAVDKGLVGRIVESLAEQGYTAPGMIEGETREVINLVHDAT